MAQCKLPNCRESAEDNGFCETCNLHGYEGDYELYKAYLYEGHSRHGAMRLAGLRESDPVDD